MRYYRSIPPAAAPLTLEETKEHLAFTDSERDGLVASLILGATQWLDGSGQARDGILGRALITQTWVLETAAPERCRFVGLAGQSGIRLRHGPVQSVTKVEVLLNGVYSIWSSTKYRLAQLNSSEAVVVLAPNESWPSYDTQREDAFRVTYVAGYGDTAAAIPEPLRIAMKMTVGGMIENRESQVSGPLAENPAVMAFIAPFRVFPI